MTENPHQRDLGVRRSASRSSPRSGRRASSPSARCSGPPSTTIGFLGRVQLPGGVGPGFGSYTQAYRRRDPGVRAGRVTARSGRSPRPMYDAPAPGQSTGMTTECSELGGHGIVGVSLTIGSVPGRRAGVQGGSAPRLCAAPGSPPLPQARSTSDPGPGRTSRRCSPSGWVPAGLALGHLPSGPGTTTG